MARVRNKTTSRGNVPVRGRSLDNALFRAWQAGDAGACEEIWELFHKRIYTVAVWFCRRVGDPSTAEDSASGGFLRAWKELELEPNPGKLRIEWRGEKPLEAYVRALVLLRCRDEMRIERRWLDLVVDALHPEGEAEDDLFGWLGCTPAMQEHLVRGELLRRVLRLLAIVGEVCRDRPVLHSLVEEIQEYVRRCLIEAGRQQSNHVEDGKAWEALTLDELSDAVEPDRVEITRSAMYRHIREHLALEDNVLFLRMREVRKLLTQGAAA